MTPEQTLTPSAGPTDRPTNTRSPRLVRLHDTLWRVVRPDGEILGYVEAFGDAGETRYQARRFVPRQRRFVVTGEFWRHQDAVDALRFG